MNLKFHKWCLSILPTPFVHKPGISLALSSATGLSKFTDLHSPCIVGQEKKNGIIIRMGDRGSFTVPHLSVCVLAAGHTRCVSSLVRHMASKQRRGYTSPHYNLQKGSVWRITGVFRLLLSKTELSAELTPFFLKGENQTPRWWY